MERNGHDKATAGKTLRVVAIATCLFAVVFAMAGCSCAQEPKVSVPNVTGMEQTVAENFLQQQGFKIGNVTQEASDTITAGRVVSQDPSETSEAAKGSSVNLVISKGSDKQVAVPNLTGKTQAEAEEALFALNLMPHATDPEFSTTAPGKVFKQSINPGTQVTVGTVVNFTVALGQETATVPIVVGKSQADAIATLSNAGFNVDTVEEYNANVELGLVISQNPNPNLQVVKGSKVTIVISKGAAPEGNVAVPNFMTLTLEEAQRSAQSAGLLLEVHGDKSASVYDQAPTAGTMVKKGTTIKIWLGAYV